MNAFVHEKRGAMTASRKAKIFLSNNGCCHACGRKLWPGDDYDIDHKIALECGGTDDDANLAPICDGCHTIKTRLDHGRAAKGKRIATKHCLPSKDRKTSRPMPGGRNTPWKKTMDGRTLRRDAE